MNNFTIGTHTDIGIRKKINQDSLFLEIADTQIGPVLIAAICDGMGGLSEGEVASAIMTEFIKDWFETSLAAAICKNERLLSFEAFQSQYNFMIRKAGEKISKNSSKESGTTICTLLCACGIYYTANVGDSRAYFLKNGDITQLTRDQTVVQQQFEEGKITRDEMETHPQRSVLLQCVGASDIVVPEYTQGIYKEGDLFLLCSDGFRHKISKNEICEKLTFQVTPEESVLNKSLIQLTELAKERGEKDNISSIAIFITRKNRF